MLLRLQMSKLHIEQLHVCYCAIKVKVNIRNCTYVVLMTLISEVDCLKYPVSGSSKLITVCQSLPVCMRLISC